MEQIGRYQILGELGRGAMGVVYRALDPALDRTVAIKCIRWSEFSDGAERQQLRERLLREAQSAGRLSHPDIVMVYDVLETPDLAYISMEYVNGPTFEQLLAKGFGEERHSLLTHLQQMADALDYAHSKGIIHRDIKPANVIIQQVENSRDRIAKITDFGVAKFISHQQTANGAMIGTPNYMSPEQIQGLAVDGRTDQFALAVVAYEVLTGEKPFSADNLPTLFYRICREQPVPPERVNTALHSSAGAAFHRALAKEPGHRFPNCREFIEEVVAACGRSTSWTTFSKAVKVRQKAEPAAARLAMGMAAGSEANRGVARSGSSQAGVATPNVGDVTMDMPAKAAATPEKAPARPEPVFYQRPPARPAPPKQMFGKFSPQQKTVVLSSVVLAVIVLTLIFSGVFRKQQLKAGIGSGQGSPGLSRADRPAPQSTAADSVAPPIVKQPSSSPPQDGATQPGATDTQTPLTANDGDNPETRNPRPPAGPVDFGFVSDPAKARVTVDHDETMTCETPCRLRLIPGRHTLVTTLNGYEERKSIIQIPERTSLYLSLQQSTGSLTMLSDPAGASIIVDGKELGKTPNTLRLTAGKHNLQFKQGDLIAEEEIDVKPKSFETMQIKLQRQQALESK